MKAVKSLFSLVIFSFLLFSTSCDKDGEREDGYFVVIDIEAPETVSKGVPFSVEVSYSRANNTIHNVKVEILNDQGHSMMNLIEQHVHQANSYTFMQDDVIIEEAGTYTIRAFSSDMDEDGEHGEEHGESGHDTDDAHGEKSEEDAHNTVEKIIKVQ